MSESLYLVAHIAGRGVAIAADGIESVVDIGAVVPVPRGHPAVRGLAALRSRVVTVIDTWMMLGLPTPARPSSRAVIIRAADHHYAILLDTLEDVAPFAIAPLFDGLALDGGWRRAARGIVERDGEPILILDLAELVPAI